MNAPVAPHLREGAPWVRGIGLTLRAGGRTLFEGLDLAVSPGELVVLTGPNGSGKSTLLRTLLGLERPAFGRVERIEGVRIGYVPQLDPGDAGLPFPASSIVAQGLEGANSSFGWWGGAGGRAGRRAVIAEALTRVGYRAPPSRRYTRLSGGERRRVLLARALVGSPDLLALDEPTAGVDAAGEGEVLDLIVGLNRERGTSIIWVAHGIQRLEASAHRVIDLGASR